MVYIERRAFVAIFIVDGQIEVRAVAQPIDGDDGPFELKDGDPGAIEGHPRRLLLRLELEKDRGRHDFGTSRRDLRNSESDRGELAEEAQRRLVK